MANLSIVFAVVKEVAGQQKKIFRGRKRIGGFMAKAKSISHVQGKGVLNHNNREFTYSNVDPERTKDNITYVNQSLDEAYTECFGQAVDDYNSKQKRADRRIDDYYQNLFGEASKSNVATSANGENSFYEVVIQIGDMYNSKVGTPDGELVAKCLDKYMQGFQERNPQFHVFNAVLHMDEKTPHLHIDYVPVASGYKNGMQKRNSISKALANMGYGTDKECINRWRLSERKILEDICREHKIEIKAPEKGRGKSLTVEEYKKHAQKGFKEGQEKFVDDWEEYIEQAEKTEKQYNVRHRKILTEVKKLEKRKTDAEKYLTQKEVEQVIKNNPNPNWYKIDESKYKHLPFNKTLVDTDVFNQIKTNVEFYYEAVIRDEKQDQKEKLLNEREKALNKREIITDKELEKKDNEIAELNFNLNARGKEIEKLESDNDRIRERNKQLATRLKKYEPEKPIPKAEKHIQQSRNIMQNLDDKSRQAKQQNKQTTQMQRQAKKLQNKKQNDHDI